MISTLRHLIPVGEGSSRLSVLVESPPLSSFDMLLTTRGEGVWELDVCGSPS